MVRAVNAIDFWRGFALITIFINHIPGVIYDRFTSRNFSISDSAELFVFLAGWSLRHIVGRPEQPKPASQLIFRLGGRALTLYAAHMLIVMLAITILASASILLDNSLLLEWHNAAAVFFDPVNTHIGLSLLSHQLGYFDILPLYVVLMVIAPVIALIDRWAPRVLLPLSIGIYLAALSIPITIPTWPTEGQWFFNPLCWQLVYVLGFVMAKPSGVGAWVKKNIRWIRTVSTPLVIGAALMVIYDYYPDPTKMPEPRLLFIVGKTFVTPIRLLQFLALVAVFSVFYPYVERVVPRLVSLLSMLGRNSLEVFCVSSVLSLICQVIRSELHASLATDTVLVGTGILIMLTAAWLAEWQDRVKRLS
jgi:hypothetical protein